MRKKMTNEIKKYKKINITNFVEKCKEHKNGKKCKEV